ncbi:hypothetical protein [Janibacter sp. LM]|uniref:recombination directionality factor n=1 Tax=Janibacter sp. LM TaxID=3144845 RepID=UPI0031F6BDDD
MPILTIQRRHAEHGRIRIGQKVATRSGKTRPDKLDRFRFTSGNRDHIEALATLYGGTASEWKNGSKTEYEVVTDARSIPVIAVKGGISQWMETWSGGGCTHRCDGYTNVLTDTPCDPDDPAHANAKPTTRLSVMLRDLESLGVWRLETHGWNAAAELPNMVELSNFVGDYVPANLVLQQRTSVSNGETKQYVVPVLDLAITKQRLNEVMAAAAPAGATELEAGSGGALQLEQGPAVERPDYEQMLADAVSVEDCQNVWRAAGASGHLDDDLKALITGRASDIKAAADADLDPAPTDGEIEPEPGGSSWQDVVAAAGAKGITTSQLAELAEQQFAQPVADLTGEQLAELRSAIESGAVAA